MNVEEFLSYIKEAKAKATYKNYTQGLKKFTAWYGKDANAILAERFEDLRSTDISTRKRFVREIEKFHRHHKNLGFSQNSCVAYTEGIRQLFRFYDMDIKGLPTEVTRKTITTKDFIPTVQQYRDMFNSGTLLDRVIISMGLDLAWRIGDFMRQKKDDLPSLEQETPIPYELLTEKEQVISKSFLSGQTVQLLRTYIKTLPTDNPYLFPNGNGGTVTHEGINKRLKEIGKKAKIHIPKGKRFRFHAFRKRFLSECANLKIDINTAKILVGKSVSKDMLTYLSEVEHKKAFEEVHEKLKVSAIPETKALLGAKDAKIRELEKKFIEQKQIVKGLIEVFGEEIAQKAIEKLRKEGKLTTVPIKETREEAFRRRLHEKGIRHLRPSTKKGKLPYGKIENLEELLRKIGEDKEREQQEKYKKLIEENNGNGNNH